ncbi:MAG: site-specific integrase [Dehalococcoidia bacterium]
MRSKGEGSVSQRKDGLWRASLQVGGKRKWVYGKTRSEVIRKLDGLKKEGIVSGTHTLGELATEWLGSKDLKQRSIADYEDTVRLYLSPLLALPLEKVTTEAIERHYGTLQQMGRRRAAQKVHGCLRQMLSLALRWGWVAQNPLQTVKAPRYVPKQKEMWSESEMQRFLQAESYLHPLYMLLIASGCRLGEALALTWEDIGPDYIHITKTVQRVKGERVVSRPKTLAGTRKVAVPASVISLLEHRDPVHVFIGEKGGLLECSSVQGNMRRTCRQLGITEMSPHGLRHMHASILLRDGLSIPQVSRRLGHADASITMKIYAHVLNENEDDAVKAIGDAIC